MDIASRIKILTDAGSGVNKDDSSSVGELLRNRKRNLRKGNADANYPTTTPIKMSREILGQVDNQFSLLDEEGPSGDTALAKKTENVFFNSSGDNIKLQKIIKEYKHPANFLSLNPPNINPETESAQQYQSNTSFVMNSEKSLFKSKLCDQSYFNIIKKYEKLNFNSFRC